ncbi:MAG: hypothetical protein ABIS36_00190 [Chryseolinea sp.]
MTVLKKSITLITRHIHKSLFTPLLSWLLPLSLLCHPERLHFNQEAMSFAHPHSHPDEKSFNREGSFPFWCNTLPPYVNTVNVNEILRD